MEFAMGHFGLEPSQFQSCSTLKQFWYTSFKLELDSTWQFNNSNKNTWLCSMFAPWTEVMCLMQCSTKCSCQNCFCNELQWCSKFHYFLNYLLALWLFQFVMTIHCVTFHLPSATCQVLSVFLKIRMCMFKVKRRWFTWRLRTKAQQLHARTTDFNALACHGTEGKKHWVV